MLSLRFCKPTQFSDFAVKNIYKILSFYPFIKHSSLLFVYLRCPPRCSTNWTCSKRRVGEGHSLLSLSIKYRSKAWPSKATARCGSKIGNSSGVEGNNRLTISWSGYFVAITEYYRPLLSLVVETYPRLSRCRLLDRSYPTDDRPDNTEIRNLNWPFRLRRAGVAG